MVRKRVESEVANSDLRDKNFFYIPSFSSRTIVYKGLLLAQPDRRFLYGAARSGYHQRACAWFTNASRPTRFLPGNWRIPFRYMCHNGEINTVRGNVNWMNARQSMLASPLFDDFKKLLPVIQESGSDSAALDNAVELLTLSGRSLPHVMAMLMPEAWDADDDDAG